MPRSYKCLSDICCNVTGKTYIKFYKTGGQHQDARDPLHISSRPPLVKFLKQHQGVQIQPDQSVLFQLPLWQSFSLTRFALVPKTDP